jgi:hypothetical protein
MTKLSFAPCHLLNYTRGLGVLVVLLPTMALAHSTMINSAELKQTQGHYQLSADMSYQLSDDARLALQNGVPLYWRLDIKLQNPNGLWAETLAATHIRYRLQYHALLKMYRVDNQTTGNSEHFSTLYAALDNMATLRNVQLPITEANQHATQLAVRVLFERNALPLTLRPFAYLNQSWDLSSAWTVWILKP